MPDQRLHRAQTAATAGVGIAARFPRPRFLAQPSQAEEQLDRQLAQLERRSLGNKAGRRIEGPAFGVEIGVADSARAAWGARTRVRRIRKKGLVRTSTSGSPSSCYRVPGNVTRRAECVAICSA